MNHKPSNRIQTSIQWILATLALSSMAFRTFFSAHTKPETGESHPSNIPESVEPVERSARSTRDFVFYNGDLSLAGSLVLPDGDGPFPAVVMIHGSEPDTRDVFYETGDAPAFLNAGIAVFIYDRRGTGGSQGDGQTASLEDLADDAIAAVRLVKQQPEIKPDAVGVFGVSQGGTLGPLAASRSDEVDFVINVTGTATMLANQEMWGGGNELTKRGFSEGAINMAMKGFHLLYSARPLIQNGLLPLDYLWFVAKDPYLDPADYWPQVKQPLFVAYGAQDRVVPTATSVEIALPILQNGHPYNRLYVYAEAGHGIRRETGNWADGHIQTMTAWVLDVTRGTEPAPQPEISSAESDAGINRWYGTGNRETPWYGAAPIQLLLILVFSIIFLLTTGASVMPFLRLWHAQYGHLPRLTLGLSGLVNLSIMVSFLMAVYFLLNADAEGYFPPVPMHSWLAVAPLISIALTLAMLYLGRMAGWSPRVRDSYNFILLVNSGFTLFMGYWGLIGVSL